MERLTNKQEMCADTVLSLRGSVPGMIRLYEYEAIEEILALRYFLFSRSRLA